MNEATLEATLNGVLNQMFVGAIRPKIKHQTILTLRLGHHEIVVDGKVKAEARGRLDVLLRIDEMPLAVLELKRPGLELTEDDEAQACSYARLINTMPPLYVVTNGTDTRIFRTYDRKPIGSNTIDEESLAALLEAAAGVAAGDVEDAVHFLLGKSPDVFRKVFQHVSTKQLMVVMGEVADLTRPVTKYFGISRDATTILVNALSENHPVVTLIGDALSGKTNVVADLYYLSYSAEDTAVRLAPIYVNCEHLQQGLLQTIANATSQETSVPVTVDHVRHWLRSGLLVQNDARPVVVLDSWSAELSDKWGAELDELLDLAGPETFSVVVVIDNAQADRLLKTPRRGQPTKLNDLSFIINVPATLNDIECMDAVRALRSCNNITPEHGALHNTLYRLPYTWRMLAAIDTEESGVISAVLGAEQLQNLTNSIKPPVELTEDVRSYCEAVLDDHTQPIIEQISSPGWIRLRDAREKIGKDCIERLVESGLVRVRGSRKGPARVSPQIPPLLAAVAVSVVQERLENQVAHKSARDATEHFVADCQRLPYCELVGAAALISGSHPDTFEVVIDSLLQIEPTISELSADARFAILVEGREPIDIAPELIQASIEGGGRYIYGGIIPYLILSHVLRGANLENERGHDSLQHVVRQVANVRVPLITADYQNRERLQYAAPVSMYALKGGGSLVAPCNGVIEPITDALRYIALNAPKAFEALVTAIVDDCENHFPAMNRAWIAADNVSRLDTPVSDAASCWANTLKETLQTRMLDELEADESGD